MANQYIFESVPKFWELKKIVNLLYSIIVIWKIMEKEMHKDAHFNFEHLPSTLVNCGSGDLGPGGDRLDRPPWDHPDRPVDRSGGRRK